MCYQPPVTQVDSGQQLDLCVPNLDDQLRTVPQHMEAQIFGSTGESPSFIGSLGFAVSILRNLSCFAFSGWKHVGVDQKVLYVERP